MKKVLLISVLVISVFSGVVFLGNDTFAKQKDPMDLIEKVTKAKPKDCGNHNNPYHATLFNVTFKWGKGCNSSICDEIDGTFHCVDPGDYCTTTSHVHNKSISVSSASCPSGVSSSKWDCYSVYIPADGAYQNMKGKIKRLKEFDLIADAKRSDTEAYLEKNISSDTAFYGGTAKVTSANYNPEGYTWSKWGSKGECASAGNKRPCSVTMKDDHRVNAWYTRNHFKGRARIFEGNKASGTAAANTGFVDSSSTKSASMKCKNEGCNFTYDLSLKRIAGDGKTTFTSNASNLNYPSPHKPETDSDGTTYKQETKTLKPGKESCYHISFRPYGSNSNTTTKKAEACMKAEVTTFEGKSSVTGSTSGTTNWKNTNTTTTAFIDNCSPTTGCKVKFNHRMRANGIGSTSYTVSRESNMTDSDKAIAANSSLKTGTFSGNDAQVYESEELTLYPGMVVCEKLEFKPSNDTTKTVDKVYTKICASALGNAQPPDPNPDTPENPPAPGTPDDPYVVSGDSSLINIKVRNESVAKWNKFQREVYAKPGDHLEYRATYNPILQYTYYLKPQQLQLNGTGTVYDGGGSQLYKLFNKYRTPKWKNSMSVFSENFRTAAYDRNFAYTNGSQAKKLEKNQHITQGSEVGISVNERAQLNRNSAIQTTLHQVSFVNNSNKNLAKAFFKVTGELIGNIAYGRVPYNFNNDTEVGDEQETFYAGEEATIHFDIYTKPRRNDTTDGTYATVVREAKQRLEVCIDGIGCMRTNAVPAGDNGILNKDSANINGKTTPGQIKISIPDSSAGTNVCIRSEVYPENSGAATNWQDPEGNHKWKTSGTQKCFKIAKRPNLQVWGGNVYTGGNIVTSVSNKENLAGYNNYGLENFSNAKRIFGSWGELGVVSNASIRGFSSGASIGYQENNGGTLWPEYRFVGADGTARSYFGGGNPSIAGRFPGGSDKTNFCDRIPLTIANDPCNNNSGTGTIGSAASTNQAANDKTKTLNKLMADNEDLNSADYSYSAGNLSVGTVNVTETDGKIKVFYAAGNVNIDGDIVYAGSYSDLKQVPKVVVYAGENIVISCNVNRIDALLIADREVKTCDSDNTDAKANSNQLVVNGAIVTNKLVPNRTYGAASGANSVIPAEIINFDPTLYLWGGLKDENNSQNRKFDVAYTHELAPRQ